MNIRIIGKTDQGLKRQNNEDAFTILANQRCAALADGMGGAAAGEVASGIFVDAVQELFAGFEAGDEQELSGQLREAFKIGNERIIKFAEDNPEDRGMGCTAELIAFFQDRYILGHVGDSRTYLFREGELRQVTKDHSFVQHQVDAGVIQPHEARHHPMKNVILRALGLDASLSLDIIRGRVLPQDQFLLCSDGLSDMVEDSEIGRILSATWDPQEKVDALIEAALNGGGRDNVTVVLCQVLA